MSTLVVCRPRKVTPFVEFHRIELDAPAEAAVREAVHALSDLPLASWRRARPTENEWDDLMNDVCGFASPQPGTTLEASLLALARASEECVVWYPGKPLEGIAVVPDEQEFAKVLAKLVALGDIEPTLRFVRRS